jgi:hypothetical protein
MAYRRPSATQGIGDFRFSIANLKTSLSSSKSAIGNQKSAMSRVAESL